MTQQTSDFKDAVAVESQLLAFTSVLQKLATYLSGLTNSGVALTKGDVEKVEKAREVVNAYCASVEKIQAKINRKDLVKSFSQEIASLYKAVHDLEKIEVYSGENAQLLNAQLLVLHQDILSVIAQIHISIELLEETPLAA